MTTAPLATPSEGVLGARTPCGAMGALDGAAPMGATGGTATSWSGIAGGSSAAPESSRPASWRRRVTSSPLSPRATVPLPNANSSHGVSDGTAERSAGATSAARTRVSEAMSAGASVSGRAARAGAATAGMASWALPARSSSCTAASTVAKPAPGLRPRPDAAPSVRDAAWARGAPEAAGPLVADEPARESAAGP